MVEHLDPAVAKSQLVDYRSTAVGAPVIHKDKLYICKKLLQYAGNAGDNGFLCIEYGDNYRNLCHDSNYLRLAQKNACQDPR